MRAKESGCVKTRIKAKNGFKTVITTTLSVTAAYLEGNFILIIIRFFLKAPPLKPNNVEMHVTTLDQV